MACCRALRPGQGQRGNLGDDDRSPARRRPGAVGDGGGRAGKADLGAAPPTDEVAEAVEATLERERVRRCLEGLTELQRESITLAYYGGYSYREVAGLLGITLGTIKTRIRDGLIRLRDCMGVTW